MEITFNKMIEELEEITRHYQEEEEKGSGKWAEIIMTNGEELTAFLPQADDWTIEMGIELRAMLDRTLERKGKLLIDVCHYHPSFEEAIGFTCYTVTAPNRVLKEVITS